MKYLAITLLITLLALVYYYFFYSPNFEIKEIKRCYKYDCSYKITDGNVDLSSFESNCFIDIDITKLSPLLKKFKKIYTPVYTKGSGLLVIEYSDGTKKYLIHSKDFQCIFTDVENNQTYLMQGNGGYEDSDEWRKLVIPELIEIDL